MLKANDTEGEAKDGVLPLVDEVDDFAATPKAKYERPPPRGGYPKQAASSQPPSLTGEDKKSSHSSGFGAGVGTTLVRKAQNRTTE